MMTIRPPKVDLINHKIVMTVVSMLVVISCISDKKSTVELIQGTWQLESAKRNERPTNSLEGMYMLFDGVDQFESNLLGDTAIFTVRIEGGGLYVDHGLINFFDITELTDSTLKLKTEINEDELLFVLKK